MFALEKIPFAIKKWLNSGNENGSERFFAPRNSNYTTPRVFSIVYREWIWWWLGFSALLEGLPSSDCESRHGINSFRLFPNFGEKKNRPGMMASWRKRPRGASKLRAHSARKSEGKWKMCAQLRKVRKVAGDSIVGRRTLLSLKTRFWRIFLGKKCVDRFRFWSASSFENVPRKNRSYFLGLRGW